MQTATLWVTLGKLGPVVRKEKVTPAEAAVFVHLHEKNAGTFPLSKAELTADVERNGAEERQRLLGIFDPKKLDKVFAGSAAKLPEKFSDVFTPDRLALMGLAKAPVKAPTPSVPTPPTKP